MSRQARVAFFLGLLLALPACAELRWHKPGTDETQLQSDTGECRRKARLAAMREPSLRDHGLPEVVGTDRAGRPVVMPRSAPESERLLREQDHFTSCMREKGYRLVPVEGGAPRAGASAAPR
ncbi:MAG: hypothetical protein HY323_09405 [Betaproteobacteria bacterium]|nr:hypothetical protein [Betaproteobacteria bacterium]